MALRMALGRTFATARAASKAPWGIRFPFPARPRRPGRHGRSMRCLHETRRPGRRRGGLRPWHCPRSHPLHRRPARCSGAQSSRSPLDFATLPKPSGGRCWPWPSSAPWGCLREPIEGAPRAHPPKGSKFLPQARCRRRRLRPSPPRPFVARRRRFPMASKRQPTSPQAKKANSETRMRAQGPPTTASTRRFGALR